MSKMLGSTYTRRSDKHVFRVVAVDPSTQNWVLQDETEFSSPLSVEISALRADFVKAADAPAPEPEPDAEALGWQRLSAEQKLASLALAAHSGELVAGDMNPFNGEELTAPQIGKLRRFGRRRPEPTPEEAFAKADAESIKAAADKIWASEELTASFEIGELEVSPFVATELDRRIKVRNFDA